MNTTRTIFAACLLAPLFVARAAAADDGLPALPDPDETEAEPAPARPSPPPPAKAPPPSARSRANADDVETAEEPPSRSGCPVRGYHCHDGFYLRLAGGPGYLGIGGRGPHGDISANEGTFALTGAIGGTFDHGVVLAGYLHVAATNDRARIQGFEPATVRGTVGLAEFGGLLDWYPEPAKGWHLGAGLGFGGAVVDTTDSGGTSHATGALSGMLFGGYDFWVNDEWSLGLLVVAAGVPERNVRNDDQGRQMGAGTLSIEASVLFH